MWENRPRAALYLRDVVHAGVRPNAGVDKSSGTRLRASDIVAHQCFAWGVCGSVVLRVVSLGLWYCLVSLGGSVVLCVEVWFHWGAIPTTRWDTWLHSPNCFATQAGQCPEWTINNQWTIPCQTIPTGEDCWKLRNSASSFHWLSSSIFTVCSFVVPHP